MRRSYESRLLVLALAAGLPAVVISFALLWHGDFSTKVVCTLGVLVLATWFGFSFAARDEAIRPLQTVANLLLSLREGDFTVRGHHRPGADVVGLAIGEVNTLATLLQEQRTTALEATALLAKVMEEIDIAIIAFDSKRCLRMLNTAAERLLGGHAVIGQSVDQLQLAELLDGEPSRTLDGVFSGGPWELRRRSFRQRGEQHALLVLTDLRRALREEERQAWQRLVRVLGHEIGNSLAPIQSIAGSLRKLSRRASSESTASNFEEKLEHGLEIIERRAEALDRFMQAYSRLSRLPPPNKKTFDVATWIRRMSGVEQRLAVTVEGGPELTANGDVDQLDQVLINLLRNATDATLETGGGVRVRWTRLGASLQITIEDDGPGIAEASNLFVPFFTTKPNGSGIGLALSRQIVEGHGGALTLESRSERSGCIARVLLPLI